MGGVFALAANNSQEIFRRAATEYLNGVHLVNRPLCLELVDWVLNGAAKPSGEIDGQDVLHLYHALRLGIEATRSETALPLDQPLAARLNELTQE